MIDIVRAYYTNGTDGADGTGTISRQLYAHAIREQRPSVDCDQPPRLDVIGTWAYEQTFTVE